MSEVRGPEGLAIFIADEEPIGSPIVYVNDAFVRMSGYTLDQLVGHSALLLAGARPDRARMRSAREAIEKRGTYEAIETRTRPDGSTYHVEVRLERIGVQNGAAPRIVLTQREVH